MVKAALFALLLSKAVYSVLGDTLISLPSPPLSFSSLPSSTSSSAPTQTPIFIFSSLPTSDIDTCSESLTISWAFGGPTPPKGLTLYLTNVNVSQPDPPTTSSSSYSSGSNTLTDRSGVLTARAESESVITGGHTTITSSSGTTSVLTYLIEVLSTDLDPSGQVSFTWQQADVPQGWYEFGVNATDAGGVGGVWTNFAVASPSLFVRNGSDVSCLITNPGGSPTQTSSSTSASATTTGQTGAGGQPVPTSGSLSSSGSVNKGAIAGGVIGGVAVIAAALGAYFFMRRSGSRTSLGRGGPGPGSGSPGAAEAGGRPGGMGKWGVLGSFDSAHAPASHASREVNTKDVSAIAGVDQVTATNTAANARSPRSSVFGFGGLAALGFAKNQSNNPQSPPSAYTGGATSKKSRRPRYSQTGSHASAGSESMRGIMSTSQSDSSFSPTSSGHEPNQSYGWLGYHHGANVDSTRPSEDDDYVYSPYDEKNVPMRTLSPTSSSAHSPASPHAGPYQGRSPFSDAGHGGAASPLTPQTPEEAYQYQSYPPSSDSVNVASGVGFIPIGYEPSPFATPPPSAPASRTNSRSYSRNSASSLPSGSVPSSAVGVAGHSSPSDMSRHGYVQDPSQLSLVSSSEGAEASGRSVAAAGRSRAKSEHSSPTSPRSAHMYGAEAPDVPVTPGNDSLSLASSKAPSPELVMASYDATSHARRASSPDVFHASPLNTAASKANQPGPARRTHRKPVPVYGLEEQEESYLPSPTSTQDHSTMQPQLLTKSTRPGPARRPVPAASTSPYPSSSQNPSSSSVSTQRVHPHVLEHKDSAHSLASLRNMEGDLSGYGAVLGQGGKQMHLLIPDMPLAQD